MDYRLRQDIDAKLQGEIGTIYKADQGDTSVALIYPNTYYVGMSNLGFQAIYGFLNEIEGVRCERAFLPEPEALALYEQTHTALCSYESQTPLDAFAVVAFSVSFENDYPNILKILELAQIPLKAADRKDDDPYLLLGGAVTTINPEPLAMFFDLAVIGDGECVLAQLIAAYRRFAGKPARQAFLEDAAAIPGVYVPSLYAVEYDERGLMQRIAPRHPAPATVTQCVLPALADYPAYSRILTENTEFGGLFLLQINRGCPYRCRFCHTGYTQQPLRHLPLDVALRLIRLGLQHRDRIGLIGAAVAEYPHLRELCAAITAAGGKISVSSLRMSTLAESDGLLQALLAAGQKTITLAPEAGTERLRKMARKALSDQALAAAIERVASAHVPHLKLYFLVGLPTETDADVEAIIDVCRKCHHLMLKAAQSQGKMGKMTISVNPFVPKPFTPLQWAPMAAEGELKRKIARIKQALRRLSQSEVIHELPKWAVWQGILARGDRKLGHVLLLMLQYEGDWKKAFRELNLHPDFYVHRSRRDDELLPWQHLQVGASPQALREEYHHISEVPL